MPQIERRVLEIALTLRDAQAIVEEFQTDVEAYPHAAVHSRSGICKVFIEEFCPLVELARQFSSATHVRLLPEAHQGPDGEIRLHDADLLYVQITCAHEGYQRALLREELHDRGIAFTYQHRHRDTASGRVIARGPVLAAPAADLLSRKKRVVNAIAAKEGKFYPGTDTLLVVDDPASFEHLRGLHSAICTAVRDRPRSPYREIWVACGDCMKRVVP